MGLRNEGYHFCLRNSDDYLSLVNTNKEVLDKILSKMGKLHSHNALIQDSIFKPGAKASPKEGKNYIIKIGRDSCNDNKQLCFGKTAIK